MPDANASTSTDTDITTTIFRTLTSTSFLTSTQDVTTSTSGNDKATKTSWSSISGPILPALTYSWSQYITPTIIGTVDIVINTDTNKTFTTTKTNTEYATNGSLAVLSRTDTNAAGTVTASQAGFVSNITV